MRFICDDMLGRLAKWLRILGFDTVYRKSISDTELLKISLQENRILLTRDRHLPGRYMLPTYIIIKSDNYMEQLQQVMQSLHIVVNAQMLLSRCLICNQPLVLIEKGRTQEHVPPFVYQHHDVFHHCTACNKIYWKGTHHTNTVSALRHAHIITDA